MQIECSCSANLFEDDIVTTKCNALILAVYASLERSLNNGKGNAKGADSESLAAAWGGAAVGEVARGTVALHELYRWCHRL